MSIRIKTREKLNANAYRKIVIRGLNGNYFVKIDGENPSDEYVSSSYKLSDSFRKRNDCDKIVSIVESFLEHTEINSIELSAFHVGYKGNFVKISGTRDMYLQLDDKQLLYDIMKMIQCKFDRDRNKYCINSDINNSYNIYLNRKLSYYGRECISCEKCAGCEEMNNNCPNVIQFKLMYIDGMMVPFDKQFIQKYIYDKLCDFGATAYIYKETEDIKVGGVTKIGESCQACCISCGDLLIRFVCTTFTKDYVFDFCNQIVNKYNDEIIKNEQIKKRQLKMEGF